jgi:hypothetical protein
LEEQETQLAADIGGKEIKACIALTPVFSLTLRLRGRSITSLAED